MGLGRRLLGLPHAVPVSSWVPILMFTILFGLSMDYEVFLLSRVREDWLATGDAQAAWSAGWPRPAGSSPARRRSWSRSSSASPSTPDVTVKMIGVGMAAACSSTRRWSGWCWCRRRCRCSAGNWWLPGWLDRLLPRTVESPAEPEPHRELVNV